MNFPFGHSPTSLQESKIPKSMQTRRILVTCMSAGKEGHHTVDSTTPCVRDSSAYAIVLEIEVVRSDHLPGLSNVDDFGCGIVAWLGYPL